MKMWTTIYWALVTRGRVTEAERSERARSMARLAAAWTTGPQKLKKRPSMSEAGTIALVFDRPGVSGSDSALFISVEHPQFEDFKKLQAGDVLVFELVQGCDSYRLADHLRIKGVY